VPHGLVKSKGREFPLRRFSPHLISLSLAGFFVVASLNTAGAQQLDCNSLAQVNQYGGCSGFCRNFARAWGSTSEALISQCINNCNNKLAQCAGGGGGGGGASQTNCQWYSKGNIRKRICRIY
jgi:hypothetical protein